MIKIEESDVVMRCFGDTIICKLIGVYTLHLLRTALRKESVGSYHEERLEIIRNSPGAEIERKRKQIIYIFQGDKYQMFHLTKMFLIEQNPRRSKHYATVFLMKYLNTKKKKKKKVKSKHRMAKKRTEERRSYGLIYPFPWV